MRRRFRRSPSPSMAVAFVALLLALSGTAIALPGKSTVDSGDIKKGAVKNSDLGANAVTSRKVRNGSLRAADFARGQIPAGPAGSQGPKGDTGATGPRGPSNGFASFKNGPVGLPFSTTAFTTLASLDLPAGSFLVHGKSIITNNAGTGDTEARCRLTSPTSDFDEAQANLEDVNTPGSANAGTIALNVPTTLSSAGTVTFACRNEGNGLTNARFIRLSAIQVEALSNVASP